MIIFAVLYPNYTHKIIIIHNIHKLVIITPQFTELKLNYVSRHQLKFTTNNIWNII